MAKLPATTITTRPLFNLIEIRGEADNKVPNELLLTLNPLSTTKLEISSENPAILDAIEGEINLRQSPGNKSFEIVRNRQDKETLLLEGDMVGAAAAIARTKYCDGMAQYDQLVTQDWVALSDALTTELRNRFSSGLKEKRLPASEELSILEKVLSGGAKRPGQREITTANLPG